MAAAVFLWDWERASSLYQDDIFKYLNREYWFELYYFISQQSFHNIFLKIKTFPAGRLRLPGWACVISFYQLLSGNNIPQNVVTDQSESSIPQSCVIRLGIKYAEYGRTICAL